MVSTKYSSIVKFIPISASVAGDNIIVAGSEGVKIRVISCFLVAGGAVTAEFRSGSVGPIMTGQTLLDTNSGFVLNENNSGWFETDKSDGIHLFLGGAVSAQGCLSYIELLPGQG